MTFLIAGHGFFYWWSAGVIGWTVGVGIGFGICLILEANGIFR